MPSESTAQRLLPQLRQIAREREAETGDGQLLGAFVASRDGDAFAALVRRHGPMVFGVCRRVIGDVHLAEDAFQATFLVLARRAAVVRPRHLVGPWLHGVAYRTALKARGSAARRKAKEKQVDAMPQPAVSTDEAWADLQPVLDAELARLPDKYRVPVVLCDLGGRPQREVARELKLPATTLANRLAAARRLLARRLTDRGVALSGGAVASALAWHAATSAVPPALVYSTVRAACVAAAGGATGIPAPILELSEGVMRMFVLRKLKAIAVGAATCLVVLAGLGSVTGPSLCANPEERPGSPPSKSAKVNPAAKAPESEDAKFLRRISLDLRGTVPSLIEMHYFLEDRDPRKRQKVTEWMLPEHGKRPVSKRCASCHRGVVMADFDVDGFADITIAVQHRLPAKADEPLNAEFLHGILKQSKEQNEVEAAKARVEEARALVEVARAEQLRAAEIARRVKQGIEDAQKRAMIAQARLDQTEAQLNLAEAHLKATEVTEKAARESIDKRAHGKRPDAEVDTEAAASEDLLKYWSTLLAKKEPTDLEFLRRVSLDIRGLPPTKVEENYFLADKDPKKREKLLKILAGSAKVETARDKFIESLLDDPAVQARWAELWKERIAAEQQKEQQRAALEAWVKKPSDRLARLLSELLDGKKPDDQVLDALCLATMARFATATEKKVILDGVKGQADRRVAWDGVLRALASTNEAKAHADGLARRASK